MLLVHRTVWFKASAVFTAASMLWFTLADTAHAATRVGPARGLPVEEVAARLGIDAASLSGKDTDEAQRRRIEKRRADALLRLTALTDRKSGRAEVEKQARDIRRAHAPDLLAGIAHLAEEARDATTERASGKGARSTAAASRLEVAASALERTIARAEALGLGDVSVDGALSKARKLAGATRRAARSETAAPDVQRLAPPRRAILDTRGRQPSQPQHLVPPRPRDRVQLGIVPDLEQRAFYASLLDAPGLQVDTEVGRVDAALIAAGIAPAPMLAFGSVEPDLDLLLALAAGSLAPPGAADLADGPDARITPEIRQKVVALESDPIAIYNFVHDEFDAEPYYGAKKGSVGAWEERAGNDADLSSVLIALLRAAGIPSRFEYGTVDLTTEQAMAWTGTTDVEAAGDALATGGIPTTIVDTGAGSVVRVEHVWVRAYVPYSNYRGLPRANSRAIWVRLDPTLQRVRMRQATNVRGKVSFDYASFLSQVGSETPLTGFERQLRAYAQSSGIACKSLDDLIPARERVPDGLSLLPAELPALIHGTLATFAGLPSSMRHSATIDLGGVHAVLPLSEIYGSALTVRYRGATAADEATIASAGGISRLAKPSAVRVVPTLVIDGVERTRGSAVVPGTTQEMTVAITSPHDGPGIVRHQLYAGSVFAIGFPVGKVPDSLVERREVELSQAALSGIAGDDLEAARGNRALWRYFWHVTRDWERLFGLEWARVGFGVSEGIAGRTLVPERLYDVPISVRPGNFIIDVPRLVVGPYTVDGLDRPRLAAVFELAGYDSSTWEHLIWEETVHNPSISTVRLFQASRQQGQQLRTLTSADAAIVPAMPFSDSAKEDIADALHRGLVVTIGERPVTWGTYPNAEAYALKDPRTGAADYRITGLYSGGASDGAGSPNGSDSCPACSGAGGPAASMVSFSDGGMYFAETDLTVPARGIPVAFTRRYNSISPYGGRLGPGWQHTYEERLVLEPDGAITFVNDQLKAQRFSRAEDGSFVTPAGFHEALSAITGGYRLVFKDGVEYRFRPDGQLSSIQDPSDHVVLLGYDSGRLTTVRDATARTALTFDYDDGGLLSAVHDLAGRVVQFTHEGGSLATVTDVVNHVQRYGYDGAHRMTSKTDKNGNVTYEVYDGAGRWIASQDPFGNGRAVSYDALNRRALHESKTGAITVHEYNEHGNPVSVTDALGNRREMGWDGAHNKLWEKDARGNQTNFTHDGEGNLLTRTDATSGTTTYTYGAHGQVLTVTTNGKLVAQNTYDGLGRLETATDALGKVTRYTYTADGLPETITQPGSAITTLVYNADGTVKSITDPESGTTELGYDAYGHLHSVKDALQHGRTLDADAAGRIQSMTDALQKTTAFEYDAEGNRTAVVDADLKRTEFGYDALNRLLSVTDAAGGISLTEYDAEDRVLVRTDPLRRKTRFRYDATGRLADTTDGAGNTTTQGFCADVSGQPCAVVDPLGNLTEVQVDALGRPTVTIDANGVQSTQHYDAFGRRDLSVSAGVATHYEYDDAGRLKKVTDALQGVTEYGYDDRGNRTSVKDANGHTTYFGYDRANRLLWERNPIQAVGSETRYEYDAAGNRRFKTDGNGHRTEYVYDANRRLTNVLFQDGTSYEYAYDARGNRTLEKSPAHERGLDYDDLGRLERVEDRTLGRVITYAYDAAGQRSEMRVDGGEVTRYRWDAVGRLFELTDPQAETTRFGYDAGGRRTSATYGNGTRAAYTHDAIGQVLSIAYLDRAGEVQTAFGYGYDAAGNRTYKAFADGTKETYGYDALGRLTAADYPGARHVDYGYDPVGNRVSLVDTSRVVTTVWGSSATASDASNPAKNAVGAPDALTWISTSSTAWLEVTYASAARARAVRVHEVGGAPCVMRIDLIDEGGEAHPIYSGGDTTANNSWLVVPVALTAYKVKKVKVYATKDAALGNGDIAIESVGLDVAATDTYAYNAFNQLTGITGADGSTTTFGYDDNGNQIRKQDVSGISQYVYDQDNRLTGIALPNGQSNAFEYDANGLRTKKTDSAGTTSYLLDGMSVIAQYAPDGARQAWYTQSLARIDEVLSVVNSQGKYWYQADALGSTYALTTAAGDVQARGGYDVFGAPVAMGGQTVGQPFGFTGREHELDSGLVYARARYLNPALGAWTQPDPAKFVDGLNPFVYAHSRPTALRDPTGLLAGLPLIPLLLTDIAFTLNLDVGLLLSFGFPGVVIVVGGVVAVAAAVAILVSLVMLIDAVRADYALRVSQDSYSPSRTRCIDDSAASSVQMVPIGTFEYSDEVEDNADFEQFTADVRRNGILVPVRYVRSGGRNWLVDGNHRVKAALRSGETQIPAEEVSLPYGRFQTEADLRDYSWSRFMDSENR